MFARLRALSFLALGLVSGASLALGYAAWGARESHTTDVLNWRQAQLFAEVYERIKLQYVDEVPDAELMDNSIRGALAGLDPYSAYLDAKEFEEMRMSTAGEYSGIGVEISLSEGVLKVIAAIDDSPAAHAGIASGDAIIAVDKIPVNPDNLNESVDRLRGKAGTRVRLTITRAGKPEPFDVVLTRGAVQVHSVKEAMLEPGYGYLRISQFNENTGVDFSRALNALEAQNSLHGLVLDLRNNPGGVLDAAVAVADAMLDRGVIVTADGRTPDAKFSMEAHPGDLLNNAPIAILVNGGSASAAEIVAGALKDNARATLIGQTTYGKGSVQSVLPLSGGGALKLTTSRYHTPSGASIQNHGIVPDVVVDKAALRQSAASAKSGSALLAEDAEVRLALEKVKELMGER